MPEYEIAIKKTRIARIKIMARNLDEALGKVDFLHETNCIPVNLFLEDKFEIYPDMLPGDDELS